MVARVSDLERGNVMLQGSQMASRAATVDEPRTAPSAANPVNAGRLTRTHLRAGV